MFESSRANRAAGCLAGLLILTAVLAAPAGAAKIHSRYDRDADFSSYRTFRWHQPEKPAGPRVSPGGVLYVAIRDAVTEALTEAGLREVEEGAEADLVVSFEALASPVLDSGVVRKDLGNVNWVVDGTIRSYYEGTLFVTLEDAATGKPVWSGWTTRRFEGRDRTQPVDELKLVKMTRSATEKIMARFPPRR